MTANAKPKFAMYWAASCGGCEIAVLNIHEKILDVDANFDVVFWPVAMDAKYKDRLLRRKSQILVAFGSCANEGCIPGLANLADSTEIVRTAFNTPTTDNPNQIYPLTTYDVPEGEIHLPRILPVLKTLGQVVDVDYFMPGCPPESHQIAAVIDLVVQVLQGKAELPPKGSVIGAGDSAVCDECKRTRNVKSIKAFRRIWDVAADPSLCLLEQGIPCNGPATRSGCNARCPAAGAQCIGCYGPAEGVVDYGARLISSFASVIDGNSPEEIDRILDGLVDPTGQFYRFNLAGSLLRAAVPAWNKEKA
jgi:F420-non-reducing hydrogenase small subunit